MTTLVIGANGQIGKTILRTGAAVGHAYQGDDSQRRAIDLV